MDMTKLYSTINADQATLKRYGYFSNTIADLKIALEKKKTTFKVFYTRLDGVLPEHYERRFLTQNGNFALFYEMDLFFNELRY